MTRREFADRLQAVRDELTALHRAAPSPALRAMLLGVLEQLFVAHECAAPEAVTEFSPYDEQLGFEAETLPVRAGQPPASAGAGSAATP